MDEKEQGLDHKPLIPAGHLPSYLADAFEDLYEEDGLIVLGKGLGCLLLLASFVRFYADTKEGHASIQEEEDLEKRQLGDNAEHAGTSRDRRRPLVVILGLKDVERTSLVDILQSWGTPPDMLPIMITNEAGQGKDRQEMYTNGGVFCITSRILITDLLTHTVTANQIDGMLVAHADQVTDESTEAFILRIFHSQKQPQCSGFVKAFTETPESLLSGFGKVDKVLKALRVRRLYLYPRFQENIRNELEANPPFVAELHQSLSPMQKECQNCIAAAVQACVRELKQSTTKLEWNDSDLSIENVVTSNFDRAISRQLEQEWHKLTAQTKQLVQDLKTLRTLFQYLIQYDSISFWRFLTNIKQMSAASRNPSLWLLTPAADHLFRKAKDRVYRIEYPSAKAAAAKPHSGATTTGAKLVAVLEENPKWKLLRKVLIEIRQEYARKTKAENEGPCTVLVMVNDERTLNTIKSYLMEGKKGALSLTWLRFLENQNERSRTITNGAEGMAGVSEERRLLIEEEGRVRRILFGNDARKARTKRKLNEIPACLKKRRRVATEKGRGALTHQPDDLEREAILDDAVEELEHDLSSPDSKKQHMSLSERLQEARMHDHDMEQAMFQVSYPAELRIELKSYSSTEGDYAMLLQEKSPKYVVFYDVEVAFIRAVEIYASLAQDNDHERIKTYFLIFDKSAEEKNFMKALEKENGAFERLIQHKMTMPPPLLHDTTISQEMQQAIATGSATGSYGNGQLPLAFDSRTDKSGSNTRQGVGKYDTKGVRRDIAVDVREFRAALPSILHQGGMRLAPVTLTVGDFILSNVHCVERKSISDLYGSFASGRLYTQAEAMCKYYKDAPCLLIEFDPTKSFSLQNPNELGLDIKMDSACTKMVLLTSHFPLLRILWSKSPHETLRIFQALKKNHQEVDVDRAVEIGRNDSLEAMFQGPKVSSESASNGVDEEEEEDEINEAGRDMLLRLPGMTVPAARRIMEQVDCLADLAKLSRDELRRIAGPIAGQKLFTFFRQKQTEGR